VARPSTCPVLRVMEAPPRALRAPRDHSQARFAAPVRWSGRLWPRPAPAAPQPDVTKTEDSETLAPPPRRWPALPSTPSPTDPTEPPTVATSRRKRRLCRHRHGHPPPPVLRGIRGRSSPGIG
jgi:hypothetical protein